ncbi:sodium:solute symporter [Bacillus atrophaeus]|uniref:sodium:solute symporter family protein n=1 Tax=Bacillus atrophaeus TaxID=1452 RepID=UPI00227E8A8B|nr:sodium:solute symporter [Bacillus atrophaeus]MCY8911878.1 sodium:solute symporter [Bacillus atrophaeus]MCY8976181.1 sodium:solute symporter [Bacillus atrophaeus]MCY9115396.1 sodium:solute symporter [Bacillus atrophaeus]MCY9133535.1 sodium:solute symporter [Bacillus atrophaeus]MEC0924893.1 sodium:solute symporter [Bacillus atrophaeus]
MNAALIIIFSVLLFCMYLGIRAKKGKDMNLEQWTVGGRGFGTIFVFLLMAGEIYTTFTFLGGSGWAYGKGGPAFYIIAYGCLAYIISYWLLPAVWTYSKEHKLMSQSDFFIKKYDSPLLGIIVSLVGIGALIPYLVLQLKGLGLIVSETSYGQITPAAAIWIGAVSTTVYVMVSGIHGSAWISVVKDILILVVALFLGLYLPFHYYGGFQDMFQQLDAAKPGFLTLPESGQSVSWFSSTVLLTALGFYMWPHTFAASYSAENPKVFRKNAMIMPLYQLVLLFVLFVGFAAILQVPGLKGADADLSLLRLSLQTFDPWIVGVIGAAGLLTALVPGSMILMAASTLFAKNVYQALAPNTAEQHVTTLAKYTVPVIALISVYFTFKGGNTIVTLLLMGYSLVTQLFPALLFSLPKHRFVTKQGAFAGIITGVGAVAYITLTETTIGTLLPFLPQMMKDLNVGIIALLLNVTVMMAVSMWTRKTKAGSAGHASYNKKAI